MKRKVLIATLGFDEKHVIKSLIDIGMSGVEKIVLLVPDWDLDDRTIKAINTISEISGLAGIGRDKVVIKKVNTLDLWKGIRDIINVLHEIYLTGVDEIVFSLGGGLRILVIEAYTATLLVEPEILRKIIIRVGVEGRGEHVSFKVEEIPICLRISEQEKLVLTMLMKGIDSISKISSELKLPRSTTWKILQRLVKKKIVEKRERRYIPTNLGEILMRIYSLYNSRDKSI